jgi:hypothetical protein
MECPLDGRQIAALHDLAQYNLMQAGGVLGDGVHQPCSGRIERLGEGAEVELRALGADEESLDGGASRLDAPLPCLVQIVGIFPWIPLLDISQKRDRHQIRMGD